MTLLDENLPDAQRRQMGELGIPVRQVGFEWGRKGIPDEEILAFLRSGRRVTFLTHDSDFYRRENATPITVWFSLQYRRTDGWLRETVSEASELPHARDAHGQGGPGTAWRNRLLGAELRRGNRAALEMIDSAPPDRNQTEIPLLARGRRFGGALLQSGAQVRRGSRAHLG